MSEHLCGECKEEIKQYYKCPKCQGDIVKIVDFTIQKVYWLVGDEWMSSDNDENHYKYAVFECVDEKCGWSSADGV